MEILELFFENVKHMAWSAVFIILIVTAARLLIGKFSRSACYALWGIVALRLIFPVMLPSDFSVFGALRQIGVSVPHSGDEKIGLMQADYNTEPAYINSLDKAGESGIAKDEASEGKSSKDNASEGKIAKAETDRSEIAKNENDKSKTVKDETIAVSAKTQTMRDIFAFFAKQPMQETQESFIYIWLIGMAFMSSYFVASYIVLKRKLRFATRLRNNIFESEQVDSPFVFGIFCPKIYLPYNMAAKDRLYILRHENYHIKRKDYIVKWFAFMLLAVYWFHPLVWAAYILMNRDMELSCDEYVLRDSAACARKEYSALILSFARQRGSFPSAALAFGKGNARKRIKNVLQYKKKTAFSVTVAVALLLAIAAICLTDADTENAPASDEPISMEKSNDKSISAQKSNYKLASTEKSYIQSTSMEKSNDRLISTEKSSDTATEITEENLMSKKNATNAKNDAQALGAFAEKLFADLPDTADEAQKRDDIFLIKADNTPSNPKLWTDFADKALYGRETAELVIGCELPQNGIIYHFISFDGEKIKLYSDMSRMSDYDGEKYVSQTFSTIYIQNNIHSEDVTNWSGREYHRQERFNAQAYIEAEYIFGKEYNNVITVALDNRLGHINLAETNTLTEQLEHIDMADTQALADEERHSAVTLFSVTSDEIADNYRYYKIGK